MRDGIIEMRNQKEIIYTFPSGCIQGDEFERLPFRQSTDS